MINQHHSIAKGMALALAGFSAISISSGATAQGVLVLEKIIVTA